MRVPSMSLPVFVASAIVVLLHARNAAAEDPLVFVSAFGSGDAGGIHAFQLDLKASTLKPLHRTADVQNPFFLAVSPDQKFLYSIHAPTFGGTEPEQVAAYRIEEREGTLSLLNRKSTQGTASCYLSVDATGKSVLIANYLTGSVASCRVNADGSLSEPVSFVQHVGSSVDEARQKEPHAHCIVISPDNRFAYAADLGIDQIVCYALDAETAMLKPAPQAFVRTPPGAGSRHLLFHPNGRFLYAINELKNSVTLFDFLPDSGMLIERQTISTVPEGFDGISHTADLKITPNGQFLYGTNRGHDSLAAYRIANDGQLSLIEIIPSLGKGPQNLAITADGTLLLCANMAGNNVAIFRIQGSDGTLLTAGSPVGLPSPSCIRILE
jgi:6-phosphogluconolactonase